MSIAQVNLRYVKEEDRLLLRLNTRQDQEFRLWLTRLVAAQLMCQLHEALAEATGRAHTPALARTVSEWRQDATEQQTLFSDFRPARTLPLGATPLLVTGYRLQRVQHTFGLRLHLAAAKHLNLTLDETLLRQVLLLIERTQTQAGWQLDPQRPPASAQGAPGPTAPDGTAHRASAPTTLH